jgi:outer membrane protein assembly factor BamA
MQFDAVADARWRQRNTRYHPTAPLFTLLCLLGLSPAATSASPADAPQAVPSDAELEKAGAVIGEIRVDNQNIFNTNDLKDNFPLWRLANRLHVKTKRSVILHQLLFRPGDRFSRHLLDESERNLRTERYFYDASIVPVGYHDGKVDLLVTTRDVWTLDPGFRFGRAGGTNTTGVTIADLNLLGTGTGISLSHKTSIDRTESSIGASNDHTFGTWTSVNVNYSQLSDGSMRSVSVNSPFYALETTRAGGVLAQGDDHIDYLYDRGRVTDEFHDHGVFAEVYTGWSRGLENGWVRRWSAGLTYDERRFDPVTSWTGPTALQPDRKFVYPWIRFDLLQDDYVKLANRDQIGKTEDFYLGTRATVRVGWADSALGSDRSALLFQTSAGHGVLSGRSTLVLSTDFTGRVEEGELHNAVLQGAVRYYAQQSSKWLFFSALHAATGWRLDLENQILLGGDNGLRGYPLRYQDGTTRALLTVEQRYFTDWFPFRLFRVGAAVFADAGRTWGLAPLGSPSLGLLKDAGFGLRFGNARTGFGNIVHVDLAFPLDNGPGIRKMQFLVQTQESF